MPQRHEIVQAHLRRMLEQPDFPVFSEHIQEVMLRVDDEETSLRQITNVILKDFSLTLKVLRTANSSTYNRSGKPILTVTHAVALLGLENIRDLACGMMLFQHFQSVSTGLKELMLMSLISASHGRVTANRVGYPRPEEAYLCGMFRNLGEVLVACYLPKKYARILVQMKNHGSNEKEAGMDVLRCTYADLGEAAVQHWQMPRKVGGCIKAEYPRLTKAVNTEGGILEALSSFSTGLTSAIYRRESSGIRARLNHLLETHGPILSVRLEDIEAIAEEAVEETKATFDLLRVPLDDLRLRKQTELAIETMVREGEPIEEGPAAAEASGLELLESLTEEVAARLSSGEDFEPTNAILMILEALYRGVPFERDAFGLVAPDHSSVRGRLGLGHRIDELLEGFQFALSARSGPLAVALLRQQDLWVADDDGGDWAPVRPMGARSFGLFPVVVDRVAVGCFYAEQQWPMKLEGPVRDLISRLRDLAATAIQMTRTASQTQPSSMTSLPTPSS